jgi:hypothetical protein
MKLKLPNTIDGCRDCPYCKEVYDSVHKETYDFCQLGKFLIDFDEDDKYEFFPRRCPLERIED